MLEYLLFRNVMIMFLAGYLLWVQRRNPLTAGYMMSEIDRKLLLIRAALGYLVTVIVNACLTMISFSLLVILFQTSPFWTSILSFKMNGEPLYKLEIFGMLLCFIAVCIITIDQEENDTLITGQTSHVNSEEQVKIVSYQSLLTKVFGMILILVACLMSSGIAVINRSLCDVPYSIVLFYHAFFGIFTSVIILATLHIGFDRPLYFLDLNPVDALILFMATAMDAVGVMTQTIAFQSGNSSFVSLISFLNIIYAMLSDIFIFGENVSRTQVLAALAILAICLGIGLEKIRFHKIARNLKEAIEIDKH